MALPFHKSFQPHLPTTDFRHLDDEIDIGRLSGAVLGLDARLVVLRRRVHDPKAKPSGA